MSRLPETKKQASRSAAAGPPAGLHLQDGGAGTIYLKDNAGVSGDLIIDNGGVVTGLETTLGSAAT